jgi:diguanylate cyclase (GGDEF)-like protein/PAS domain S-box-containing protein
MTEHVMDKTTSAMMSDIDLSQWVVTATDIDDAKRREARDRRSDRMSAQALTSLQTSKAPVGIGFVDRQFRFVRLNETLASINGLPMAEHIGRSVAEVVPDLWPQLEPLYRQVMETGEAMLDLEFEIAAPTDPSNIRSWLSSYYPVPLDNEIVGLGIVLVDITASKRAEEDLRFQAKLLERAGQAIIAVNRDRVVISWNAAAEAMYGWSAAEAIGRKVVELIPREESSDQMTEISEAMARGKSWSGDYEITRRDGTRVSIYVTNNPLFDDAGRLMAIIGSSIDLTDRLAVQSELEANRRTLADAQRIANLGSFEFNVVAGTVTWSDEFHRILGSPTEGASREMIASMIHHGDLERVVRVWEDLSVRGLPTDFDFRLVRADGEIRFVRARVVAEISSGGTVTRVLGTLMDDTERVVADRVRRDAESQFEIGFEQSTIGAVIADLDGLPTRVNDAACVILGRPAEQLLGRLWNEFSPPSELPLSEAIFANVAAGHDTYEDERRYVHPDGTVVWTVAHVTLVRNEVGEGQYFYLQLQDTTRRKNLEAELAHQALHDSLTGLPNRAFLADRLVQGLAMPRRPKSCLGVIFLDIDEFKFINDSSGHGTGDDLLRQAATRISEAIRPVDTVARFGGDEFVVVCDDISTDEIERIADRVLAALHEPLHIGGQEVRVTASIGIAMSDEHSTPESMLRDSDAAMYRAKERGKGRVELFDEQLRFKAERRFSTASQLHLALERGEFTNHYQPVIDLATGAMIGAEALVRWNHPTRGLLQPAEFITLAEETGLIVPIGAWVLEQACRDLGSWQKIQTSFAASANLWMSVNLSVRQLLTADVVASIAGALGRTPIAPADLSFELTESVFMEDAEYFGRTLAALKDLGVGLAIDDFGTGYSSLSYLKRFPVDTVKVDRDFIDGLGTEPHDTALVAAIVAMAGALGLDVIAEGVETRDQMLILEQLGVRTAQGFWFARPVPADEIAVLVREAHHWQVR